MSKKRWMLWAGSALTAQGLLFGVLALAGAGIPSWYELPYLPFQTLFVHLFGSAWAIGLPLGAIVGALTYSIVIGLVLARMFPRQDEHAA